MERLVLAQSVKYKTDFFTLTLIVNQYKQWRKYRTLQHITLYVSNRLTITEHFQVIVWLRV